MKKNLTSEKRRRASRDEPGGPLDSLLKSYARLIKLTDMRAPLPIIEREQAILRERMAAVRTMQLMESAQETISFRSDAPCTRTISPHDALRSIPRGAL